MRSFTLLCLLLISAVTATFSQNPGYLEVVGSVYQANKGLEGADIIVMKGNEKVDQISTNAGGKFIVNLELNTAYTIVYTKNGSISKSVEFDTKVPDELQGQIFSLKYKIDLLPHVEGVEEPAGITKPVAKYAFSDAYEDFTYDPNYTNARKSENEKLKQEMEALAEKKRLEENASRAKAKADSLAQVNAAKAAQALALAEAARQKKEADEKAKAEEREAAKFAAIAKARRDSITQKEAAVVQARLLALEKPRKDSVAKAQ